MHVSSNPTGQPTDLVRGPGQRRIADCTYSGGVRGGIPVVVVTSGRNSGRSRYLVGGFFTGTNQGVV